MFSRWIRIEIVQPYFKSQLALYILICYQLLHYTSLYTVSNIIAYLWYRKRKMIPCSNVPCMNKQRIVQFCYIVKCAKQNNLSHPSFHHSISYLSTPEFGYPSMLYCHYLASNKIMNT